MNLHEHAIMEMGPRSVENGPDQWMYDSVLELIDCFAAQGHSGLSAPYCIAYFKTLASFEPLGPLTGEDDEWVAINNDMYQNKRCGHVFKKNDGQAYDSNGIVWRGPNGNCFTNSDSRVNITFPYTPKTEYHDVI